MPDIHHLIRIGGTVDRVTALVDRGRGFSEWWAEDVESEGANSVTLGFFGRSTVYSLRRGANSGAVVWNCTTGNEWSGTDLTFALDPAGDETILRFTHGSWRAATEYFYMCNTTWGELMYRLKAAAEGKQPGPLFRRDTLAY